MRLPAQPLMDSLRQRKREEGKNNFLVRTLRWEKIPHASKFPQTPKVGRKRNDTLETTRETAKDHEKKNFVRVRKSSARGQPC